jgi:hypothetical protein
MHWYRADGAPCYEIERTDGKGLRSTTLKDARKLGLVPSVTTILGILAKPGLTRWFQEQVILATLANPIQRVDESQEKYVNRILAASSEISKNAADRGNKIHDTLEKIYTPPSDEPQTIEKEYLEYAMPVVDLIYKIFPEVDGTWVAEESFATPYFGGKVDLHSKEHNIIIDFKTKSTNDFSKFSLYADYGVQLAAYRNGLNLTGARCYNIIISSVDSKVNPKLHQWDERDLLKGWQSFLLLTRYFHISNKLKEVPDVDDTIH